MSSATPAATTDPLLLLLLPSSAIAETGTTTATFAEPTAILTPRRAIPGRYTAFSQRRWNSMQMTLPMFLQNHMTVFSSDAKSALWDAAEDAAKEPET